MNGLNKQKPRATRHKRPPLPRADRERIVAEFLSGHKTGGMLAQEYGVTRNSINKTVSLYYQRNRDIFAETHITPIMPPKLKPTDTAALRDENERLKRQLKIEGYQIMSEILEEEYGIDLLKKAVAEQSVVSKKDTQK